MSTTWKFNYAEGPVVNIMVPPYKVMHHWFQPYREGRGKVPPEKQGIAEIYAEATYMKYHSAREEFGVVADSIPELQKRLEDHGKETLLLLESTHMDTGQLTGHLLLRFAWTGDIVIDFVGTNPVATTYGMPPIKNSGAILVYAALRIGEICKARLVFAETASHSITWWDKLLDAGEKLIKVSFVSEASARLKRIIQSEANIAIEET